MVLIELWFIDNFSCFIIEINMNLNNKWDIITIYTEPNTWEEIMLDFKELIEKILEFSSVLQVACKPSFIQDLDLLNWHIDWLDTWDFIFWEKYFQSIFQKIKSSPDISIILPNVIWDCILSIWIVSALEQYIKITKLSKEINIYSPHQTNMIILNSLWIGANKLKEDKIDDDSYVFNLYPDFSRKEKINIDLVVFLLKKMWNHKSLWERLIRIIEISLWIKLWDSPKEILFGQAQNFDIKNQDLWEINSFLENKDYIVIQPNSSNKNKEYSMSKWIELLELFRNDSCFKDYKFIFLWFNWNQEDYNTFLKNKWLLNIAKSFSLDVKKIAFLLKNSKYIIWPSTWFVHLGWILWKNTLALCNESNIELWKSASEKHINIPNDNPMLSRLIKSDIHQDRLFWWSFFDKEYVKKYRLDNIDPKIIFDIVKTNLPQTLK